MPLMISIPKGDLARGIPIAQGWKEFEITHVTAGPAKPKPDKPPSVNYVVTLKLDKDVNEREIEHIFNSQAMGFMAPFICALTGKPIQEVLDGIKAGDELNFDLESTVGKKILGKVYHDTFNGRIMSKIEDFATPGKVPF